MLKRHINNPYKLNWKLYCLIGVGSVVAMIAAVICNTITGSTVSDVIKNLALGVVASTFVALLIEIGNVRERNEKANSVYDAVYSNLQYQIMCYIQTWSCLCCIAYKNNDYSNEKHTWTEWYEITKKEFAECDNNRQTKLMPFFSRQLMERIDGIEKAIAQIDNQQYILKINEVYDESLRFILVDYRFEFDAARLTLEGRLDSDSFWQSFDAINKDLVNYIGNWIDIKYYNYCKFRPYSFYEDFAEVKRAMKCSASAEV